ncbi:MAG: hypothetical protein IT381_25580 [Deltaproteobacteria bacterium]|nr:hypothetical protein [Deltaproteobacteria bacterium]
MGTERQVKVLDHGGLAGMLFSLPFMLVGLGVIGGGVYGVLYHDVPPVILAVLVPFGVVFFCVGAVAGYNRHWLLIDADRGTATRSWGVFFPFKHKKSPLGRWEHVGLGRERRRRNKSSVTVFPVFLARQGESFPILEPKDYASARAIAERVAKACGLGIRDTAGDDVVMREAGTLDESLRDRLRRSGEQAKPPPRPANAVSHLSHDMGTLVFDLPARGFKSFAGALIGVLTVGMIAQTTIASVMMSEAPIPLFVLDAVIAFAFIAPLTIRCLTQERVRASAGGVDVIKASPLGARQQRIPAAELEELRLGSFGDGWLGSGIVLVTDKGSHTVAAGLDADELRWIAGELRRAIAA